jgi:hypothetical protein
MAEMGIVGNTSATLGRVGTILLAREALHRAWEQMMDGWWMKNVYMFEMYR